jgi:GTPase SAR1 family protein
MALISDSTVGKTAICNHYISGSARVEYHPTVGVDFFAKGLKISGNMVRLQIWESQIGTLKAKKSFGLSFLLIFVIRLL